MKYNDNRHIIENISKDKEIFNIDFSFNYNFFIG